jgi:hypothetical protein
MSLLIEICNLHSIKRATEFLQCLPLLYEVIFLRDETQKHESEFIHIIWLRTVHGFEERLAECERLLKGLNARYQVILQYSY